MQKCIVLTDKPRTQWATIMKPLLLPLCSTGLVPDRPSVNIVSLLGAIIGIGVVAKNGILMLDSVHRFEAQGQNLEDALVESGRRRLRPVLMTSLAAALGLLPLAYGIGAGSDMLKPLAIAVIGALTLSFLLSLVAQRPPFILSCGKCKRIKTKRTMNLRANEYDTRFPETEKPTALSSYEVA
ncbi:MAG: efflux RND transporter permease subunit [Methylobacter sp.]|nr:efflux RND transporter permease subunit [Methylobacter sp.]